MVFRINLLLILAIIVTCELIHAAASIKILNLDSNSYLCSYNK